MKTILDRETDTLFVRLTSAPIHESEEITPDMILDFDEEGRIAGFEILRASKNLSRSAEILRDHLAA